MLTPILPISPSPVIASSTAICQTNNQHTVTVVVTGATSVTIGGIAATNIGTNTWQRTNITGLTNVNIIATNGTCEARSSLTLQNCLCPQGEIFIDSGGDTCGQGLTNVFYNGSNGVTPTSSWTYILQNFALGEWGDVGVTATFNPASPPNISVPTTIGVIDRYRFKLINTTNGCTYLSDEVTVTAIQPPLNVIINSSVPSPALTGQQVTFSTIQGNYTYTWSGAVTGNTYQSNPITFTTPGTYTINVQVCSAPGCCTTQTISYVVGQNCTNPPLFTDQPVTQCSDIVLQHNIGSGSGSITYSAISYSDALLLNPDGFINVPAGTAMPNTGTITINGNLVDSAQTTYVYFTFTDSNGCPSNKTVIYTRATSTLTDNTNSGSKVGFNDVITLPGVVGNVDFVRIYAATAYTCAPNPDALVLLPSACEY
jgi:hypothetical protein